MGLWWSTLDEAAVTSEADSLARLAKFERVLKLVNTSPQYLASTHKRQPTSTLVTQHLEAIVGKDAYRTHNRELMVAIDHTAFDPSHSTTLAAFLSALMCTSPLGGDLVFVYSNSSALAAQELVTQSQEYTQQLATTIETFHVLDTNNLKPPCITRKTSDGYSVVIDETTSNRIKARPTNPEACRGDAPHVVIRID
jgi:hypothetical protein